MSNCDCQENIEDPITDAGNFDWKKKIEDSIKDGLIITAATVRIFFALRAVDVEGITCI